MAAIETGRVCIKTTGRTAGEKVIVVTVSDENVVTIANSLGQKEKCNIRHLFPLDEKSDVKKIKEKPKKVRKKKEQHKGKPKPKEKNKK